MRYIQFRELFEQESHTVFHVVLNELLQFGLSEEVIFAKSVNEKRRILRDYSEGQLLTNVLGYARVKHIDELTKVIQFLSLHIGEDLSINCIARFAGLNAKTVKRYIELLEKTCLIITTSAIETNERNVSIKKKYYFRDVGIRNALIRNFQEPNERTDIGRLWENFIVQERVKLLRNDIADSQVTLHYWRKYSNKHIDYIEARVRKGRHARHSGQEGIIADATINAYEIRWLPQNTLMLPSAFRKSFPSAEFAIITPRDFAEFLHTSAQFMSTKLDSLYRIPKQKVTR
jgi:predicted AAA+ superfamily ATPase